MDFEIASLDPVEGPPPFLLAPERRRHSKRSAPPTASDSSQPSPGPEKPPIELVLYVSSISPHSTAALRNLRRTLATFAGQSVKLTVHDLSKDPQRAEQDRVHFTPSLV